MKIHSFRIPSMSGSDENDWKEDSEHENGNYHNKCVDCGVDSNECPECAKSLFSEDSLNELRYCVAFLREALSNTYQGQPLNAADLLNKTTETAFKFRCYLNEI